MNFHLEREEKNKIQEERGTKENRISLQFFVLRFEHDVLMKKTQSYVDFPLENLDLTKYLAATNR